MPATRIGLIVPSSNTTMETELPEMFRRRTELYPDESYTFHSSRMRMKKVSAEELAQMNCDSERCVVELVDADCDALAYACLVAIMSQGTKAHESEQARIERAVAEAGGHAAVVTSAGALVHGLEALGAKRVGMITPYVKALTETVVGCVQATGVEVADAVSLEVDDNLAVGRLDPNGLIDVAKGLDLSNCDALVVSACVQMPSLPVIDVVEKAVGLPVLSAASSTVYQLLEALGRSTHVPNAGHLLSGEVRSAG